MKKTISIKLTFVAVVTAAALAACGGGGENTFVAPPVAVGPPTPPPPLPPTPPTPPTGSGTVQAQAGAGFAAAFNQGRTDEPNDPVANDIIPLDKTGEPIPIPDP